MLKLNRWANHLANAYHHIHVVGLGVMYVKVKSTVIKNLYLKKQQKQTN